MKEVGKLKFLKQISPSKYTSLNKCAYRTVLANSGIRQILPYSPSSHLGIIIHECLNLIFSNEINEINQFLKKMG